MDKHIGEIYGDFKIISRDKSKAREYYFVQCIYCNKQELKSVRLDNIKRGRQCFCKKDLSGQIFGFLKVLFLDNERSKEKKDSYYFCECQRCNRNKIISVRGAHLKNGNTKSCGCLNDESHRKDLRGQIFGTFKIIDVDYQKTYDINRNGTGTYWQAICTNCGKEKTLNTRDLLQNKVPNCLCCYTNSRGEQKILNTLLQLNIEVEQQKSYPDLRSDINGILRFDFFLKQYNTVIEYQGIQHYKPINYFGGDNGFENQQNKDNLKRNYCQKHNIKLIEIPYWDYDKIDKNYLLSKITSN